MSHTEHWIWFSRQLLGHGWVDQSKVHNLITEWDGLEICWQPCLLCFRVPTFHPPPALKYPENGWLLYIFEYLHLWEGSTVPRRITHIWNLAHLFIPLQSKHQGNRMPCQSQLEHPHPPSPTNTKPEDSRSQCPNCWRKVCSLTSLGQKRGWSCLFEAKAQRAGL